MKQLLQILQQIYLKDTLIKVFVVLINSNN